MKWEEISEQGLALLTTVVLPAMVASLAVMQVIRWCGGKHLGSLATVLAVSAGMYVGLNGVWTANALSDEFPWRLHKDQEEPFQLSDLGKALVWSLEEEKPKAAPEDAAAEEPPAEVIKPMDTSRRTRYWLPWLAGLALLIEFLLPLLHVPSGPGWTLRTALAMLAGRLLTPNDWRMEHPWISWALAGVIVLEWGLLTSLARRWRDGVVLTSLGFCCVAAAIVLQASGYASACDWALLLGASLVGPALLSWIWPSDTSPAAAAVAVLLPCLLLEGKFNYTEETVPLESFLLAALAPLALLPVWLPFLAGIERWTRWILWLSLPLASAVLAVVLAMPALTSIPE